MSRTKLILGAVCLALILLLFTCGPAACNRIRSLTAQGRVNDAQGGAFQHSAAEAISITGNVAENMAASDALTRQNERDIRNAKGADQGVDPAVRAAGFASLCKRASFRNSPSGRVHCTPSGGVATTR